MAQKRRRTHYEFKPDVSRIPLSKLLHLTIQQRKVLLKWGLHALVCLALLIVQDVIMSRVSIRGATTDLVAGAIILITVVSGVYDGSLFAIIASLLFVFSGSSPGPYAVAYLTIFGVGAGLLRQMVWRRDALSNLVCAGLAMLAYELAIWGTGVFLGLTYFGRIGVFLITWGLSFLVMIALYPLASVIHKIGGETWKE